MNTYITMILEDREKTVAELNELSAPFKARIQEADNALKAMGHVENDNTGNDNDNPAPPIEPLDVLSDDVQETIVNSDDSAEEESDGFSVRPSVFAGRALQSA